MAFEHAASHSLFFDATLCGIEIVGEVAMRRVELVEGIQHGVRGITGVANELPDEIEVLLLDVTVIVFLAWARSRANATAR
jgi:hypothetical protein